MSHHLSAASKHALRRIPCFPLTSSTKKVSPARTSTASCGITGWSWTKAMPQSVPTGSLNVSCGAGSSTTALHRVHLTCCGCCRQWRGASTPQARPDPTTCLQVRGPHLRAHGLAQVHARPGQHPEALLWRRPVALALQGWHDAAQRWVRVRAHAPRCWQRLGRQDGVTPELQMGSPAGTGVQQCAHARCGLLRLSKLQSAYWSPPPPASRPAPSRRPTWAMRTASRWTARPSAA